MDASSSQRYRDGLRCVDALAVSYLIGASVLLASGVGDGLVYPFCIGLHLVAATGIFLLQRAASLSPVLQTVRETYPLLLLLVLYGEVDMLVRLLYESPGYDAIVAAWDLWVFGVHPHQLLHQWLSGAVWREVFHFLYLTYYLLLVGAFMWVWLRRPASFPRVSFVLTGMFASFVVLFVAFPVAGPLSNTGVSLMTRGFFPSIVAHIYAPVSLDGIHAGAFPSSHVGMSLGIALLLRFRRWSGRIAIGLLVLGIAVSTVYGRFHYAIDALAGLVSGGLLYLFWRWVYARVQSSTASARDLANSDETMGQPSSSVESVEKY